MYDAISERTVCGPFLTDEPFIAEETYLNVVTAWLISKITAEDDKFFQPDSASPHEPLTARKFLHMLLPVDGFAAEHLVILGWTT